MIDQKKKESSEDYLERILMLSNKLGKVRSIDIANDMLFSKPSVSIAMKKLKENNFITIDKNGYIYLTDIGLQKASEVYERHVILSESLKALGIDEKTALIDACKIEHDLSEESFQKIKEHYLAMTSKKNQ